MTLVAIANALHDGRMRARFHAEPIVQAAELLLQERMPRDVALARPPSEQSVAAEATSQAPETQRRYASAHSQTPRTHVLSNGRYSAMVTAAGSGYSRWRDVAITRWREDVTSDDWGAYVFLRDAGGGLTWSAAYQPSIAEPESYEVSFCEDRAEIARRDGSLTTVLEVMVSSEDDAEVRRVSITNHGAQPRVIDVTSYAKSRWRGRLTTLRIRPSPSCSSRPNLWLTWASFSPPVDRGRPPIPWSGPRTSRSSRANGRTISSLRPIAPGLSAADAPFAQPRRSATAGRCPTPRGLCSILCSACDAG